MISAAPRSMAVELLDAFKKISGEQHVFVDDEVLDSYSHDETEDLHFLPEVVIKPGTAEEISAILKICNEHKIPVTPPRSRNRPERRRPATSGRRFAFH